MARVLAISSQTVFGPVGLSASVPALQSLGHEVLALPTITLSHHPGLGRPSGQRTTAALLKEMLEGMRRIGALDKIDAILTGYCSDAAQAEVIAEEIQQLSPAHVLVDPVIGDHGALYVTDDVASAIRDHLVPRATIITPNLFELQWLSGKADISEAVQNLSRLETLVTSVPDGSQHLRTELHGAASASSTSLRRDHVPHGTGDMLAGLYLGHRLNEQPTTAFTKAMARLESVIAVSAGHRSLQVAHVLTGH